MKKKYVAYSGTVSSGASILGAGQLCHYTCLAVISLLSFIGITVSGMPLFFLTKYAVFFWGIAVIFFAITLFYRHCLSRFVLTTNAGLLIAGFPFTQRQYIFWVLGGIVLTAAIMQKILKR